MSDKKQVFLSLETARKMWKEENVVGLTDHTSTQLFLLDNFTKEELEAKELPKSWEELKLISGYYISTEDDDLVIEYVKNGYNKQYDYRNVFPTEELAEASLALAQLLQLRDVYNGKDFKIDTNKDQYIIVSHYNSPKRATQNGGYNYVLSFHDEHKRDQFFENFEELIITALPLL